MKICKFCGTEVQDSEKNCSACGGNEFKHKCSNCGTVFENANFCPTCGIKVGEKPKKCPKCGKEYFSAACPDCGYTVNNDNNNSNNSGPTEIYVRVETPNERRGKLFLWIIGWIFMFPLPLTILLIKYKKPEKKALRIIIIAVAWLLYILIIAGYNSTNKTAAPTTQKEYATETDVDTSKATSSLDDLYTFADKNFML